MKPAVGMATFKSSKFVQVKQCDKYFNYKEDWIS